MRTRLPNTLVNPISLLGAAMALFALGIILVLLVLGASGALANPYTGILTFMLGPAVLVLGLVLIPLGDLRERRRLARLGIEYTTFPVLDMNDPAQRKGAIVFSAVTAGILALMASTTWGAAEFMESTEFCGDLCHKVMVPEATAYQASPHARVTCTSCHIGPGAPWLVKSKISGIRQVVNYNLGTYNRPIEVPIQDLRPSRDTCEQCHWPQRFYGDKLRPYTHFAQDEKNTMTSQPLVFRVGGSEQGNGIHWHTTSSLYYLPLTPDRGEIGWVRVENPDGTVEEFILPDKKSAVTPELIKSDERFMDCIDCHNRAAHHFAPITDGLDSSMASGVINPDIPWIKQRAMQAIGEVKAQVSEQEYQQTLQRIDGIEKGYQTELPQVYAGLANQIKQATAEVKNVYQRSVFPTMEVAPGTYPDWVGHQGCMRCHGKLVATSGPNTGKTISANCLTCHYPAPVVPPSAPVGAGEAAGPAQLSARPILPALVPHQVEGRETCTACHTIGGPGVNAAGGLGIPQDHQGRGNDTCLGCHAVAQQGSVAAPAASPAAQPPAAPTTAATPAPAAAPAPAATAGQSPAAPTSPPAATPAPAPAKTGGAPAAVPHPTQGREQCTTCHTVGGPGVGAPGGLGTPADHQGRPDASCLGCHKSS